MNEPIARLFVFVVLLFALLVAFTSRWTIFQAASLRRNSLNARPLLEQRRIDRGAIVASEIHLSRNLQRHGRAGLDRTMSSSSQRPSRFAIASRQVCASSAGKRGIPSAVWQPG